MTTYAPDTYSGFGHQPEAIVGNVHARVLHTGLKASALVTSGWVAIGILAAIAIIGQQPKLLCMITPMAAVLVWARRAEVPEVAVEVAVPRPRVVEGDEVVFAVKISAVGSPARWVDVEFQLGSGLQPVEDSPLRHIVGADNEEATEIEFLGRAFEFGTVSPKGMTVRVMGPYGLYGRDYRFTLVAPIRVHLQSPKTRTTLSPSQFRAESGTHLSRQRGDGCEVADFRPFRPGDNPRQINVKVSNRRGDLWIAQRHPDRGADLVLVIDTDDDSSNIRRVAQATLALVDLHLQVHDRVGVLFAGMGFHWIEASMGRLHRHRIVELILELQGNSSAAGRKARSFPDRTLPPNAIVVAFSPLSNRRSRTMLAEFRQHGFTVSVVDTLPPSLDLYADNVAGRLGARIYRLEREANRAELAAIGVNVVRWRHDLSLEQVIRALRLGQRNRGGRR